MAETILTNVGDFSGLYGAEPVQFYTNEVSTTILTGVTATKTADKDIWINGPLTYTVKVKNESGITLTGLVLADVLNSKVSLDTVYGIMVNSVASTYTLMSNVLSIPLPDLLDNGEHVISFHVLLN